MANWYDEPVTVKEVKETVETRAISKNFYDVIRAIKDKEIQDRKDYCSNNYHHPLEVADTNDYEHHDKLNNSIVPTDKEEELHEQRLDEMVLEWDEWYCDDLIEFYNYISDGSLHRYFKKHGNGRSKCMTVRKVRHHLPNSEEYWYKSREEIKSLEKVVYGPYLFTFTATIKSFFSSDYYNYEQERRDHTEPNESKWIKHLKDGGRGTYFDKNTNSYRWHMKPDEAVKYRNKYAPHIHLLFGYSKRESIFNEPSVKFNKKGEPMAISQAKEALKTILTKNNATAIKAPKKEAKTTDARLKNIEGLRESWVKQVIKMKTDFQSTGKATGIKYVPNAKKVEDSYFTAEFISKRKHLILEAGKPVFKLKGNKDSVTEFLQDIADAISIHAFDAQLLTHQRNVKKAKEEAAEKKETKAAEEKLTS
jgi:hypothetical protein